MEIWLKTNKTEFRFPVIPSEIMINGSSIESSVNLLNVGEANLYAGNNVQDIEISSFFPEQNYSFVEYRPFPDPYKCISILRDWMNRGQAVRFIIPGIANFAVRIVSCEYGEKDGTKDVYYSIKLKEVRQVTIKKLNQGNSNTNNSKPADATNDKKEDGKQKTHKVVKDDNLWDLAQKYYGKGSDYPKIKKANESKYPSLKNNNIIYVNWTLVIP